MIAPVESPPRATGALALDTYELTKRFGSFTALDHVTMRVEPGSVHALLGENGAGKSTLVKCVAGFQVAEEGSILIDGREQDVANPVVARHLGIGMVYQHFTLAPGMTVAENLLLAGGKTPAVIDWKAQRAELKQFLATTPFTLDLDARPAELAAGEKQKLELLKQLYLKPRLLILDEPTSVLTPQEADEVLGHVREFARSGLCTVLIITHKFREVMGYADAVTVLRRGRAVQHARVADTDPQRLAQAMMGQTGDAVQPPPEGETAAQHHPAGASPERAALPVDPGAAPALEIQHLSAQGDRGTLAVQQLSLAVRRGEILGVAGVSGNGQVELAQVLDGTRATTAGRVAMNGRDITNATPAQVMAAGIGRIPEDRHASVVGEMSVAHNMALEHLSEFTRGGILDGRRLQTHAETLIAAYQIKARPEDRIRTLSGGNIQKVILARVLERNPQAIVVAQPTRGLDIGATEYVRHKLAEQRHKGAAILLFSEDLDELLELSDRIAVIYEGRIVDILPAAAAAPERLGLLMAGGGDEE